MKFYDKISVEWIHGKVPTAVFLDDRNRVIKTDRLEDNDAEALTGWLSERGFQLVERRNPYPTKPLGVGEFEDSKYEYFKVANTKAFAQEFAEKRGGHLLAIESEEEAMYIALDLLGGNTADVWLAATDEGDEGQWHWMAGEYKGEQFWTGQTNGVAVNGLYAGWTEGEPNNAQGGEHCAVMVVIDDIEQGFIDVPCKGTSNVIIEYSEADQEGHEEHEGHEEL